MMQWLENELRDIEKNNQFAWMIGHVDTNECLHQYGVRLQALYDRFQNIIRFSTFGHTHSEEFRAVKNILDTNN